MHLKFPIHILLICVIFTFFCLNISMAQDLKVTDIKVANGKAYKLGDKGITVGTVYYIDRTFVVNTLPKDLEDTRFIMTANDDKGSTGANFLTFTVDRDVVVWLAHDSRGEKEKGGNPPDWLSDKTGWVKHPDMKMDVSDTNMGFFVFWSKECKKGQIVLGGNADPAAAGQGSNYLVLIKPGKSLAVESKGKVITTWAKLRLAN
ncbi:MAG: hypothetical protein AAB116_15560 [Candidatus Poribacteria bacterium]